MDLSLPKKTEDQFGSYFMHVAFQIIKNMTEMPFLKTWLDGQMDEQTDRWIEGRKDGQTDGE